MLPLGLDNGHKPLREILCLGAHCDDIEIGCGGSILQLIARNPGVAVHWVVFSSEDSRDREARESAELFLAGCSRRNILLKDFRNSYFPFHGEAIKECFEELKQKVSPDLIFTHFRQDLHQDHRLICDLTWNTFRDHFILEYEIPKYDGDLGAPNFFMHLDRGTGQAKASNIVNVFKSQRGKHWFTEDTFLSLMRLRGIEANAPDGYAEAFYSRKMIFSAGGEGHS